MGKTKISQYLHRPNNSELGLGNVNEKYMRVDTTIDVSAMFPVGIETIVVDSDTAKEYRLKSSNYREFRINQMGDYYRDKKLTSGDEVTITMVERDGVKKLFISCRKYNRVVLNVGANDAELFNIERLPAFENGSCNVQIQNRGVYSNLEIAFKETRKKRNDSPNTTDYYTVKNDGALLPKGAYYITLGNPSTLSTLVKSTYNEIDFTENFLEGLPSESVSQKNDYIEKYKQELPSFWKDEMYKWIAVKHFQNNWDIDAADFGIMFKEATRKHTNLLDTINNYPIAQLLDFDRVDSTAVRNMFRTLYDESLDLATRIEAFKSESKRIQATNPDWKTNYQDLRAISVYLMFRYPDKYFIYKYKELKIALQRLGIDSSFKGKTEPQFLGNVMEVMRGISEQLKADSELVNIIDGLKTEDCYDDIEFHVDAVDFVFYLGKRYIDEGQHEEHHKSTAVVKDEHVPYFNALRTKPFMLLAGISGTGKSRIVREFAFASCPKELQDKDKTTPGNYCMIEVKPNWHDSSELLGYYSNISKKYNYTKFVKFLVKAMHYKNTPFFVCLDEMNLAPVEQYFAEFLSVLETRKKSGNEIVSGALVDKRFFSEIYEIEGESKNVLKDKPSDKDWYEYFWGKDFDVNPEGEEYLNESDSSESEETYTLLEKGLCLPENVFIIGTVNMDDTTHQFSRKVIDRAMTIEMNGGDLKEMFGGSEALTYPIGDVLDMDTFRSEYVNADEVIERHSEYEVLITTVIPQMLDSINEVLANTPFQVSYRVLNELVIYLGVLLDKAKENGSEINFNSLATQALDAIMLMKILPRIEGDSDMFALKSEVTLDDNDEDDHQKTKVKDRINWLKAIVPSNSKKKLEEMHGRLMSTDFTRFWP